MSRHGNILPQWPRSGADDTRPGPGRDQASLGAALMASTLFAVSGRP